MRTDAAVVDASGVGKSFLDEPETAAWREWYYRLLADDADLRAPYLLQYEVGRTIQRELTSLSPSQMASTLDDAVTGIRLSLVPPARPFDHTGSLTYYDAAYVALAKEEGVPLATYDDRMAEAARSQGIPVWNAASIDASLDDSFLTWIGAQQKRSGAIATFAADLAEDDCLVGENYLDVRNHAEGHAPTKESAMAMDESFKEFVHTRTRAS